MAGQLGDQGDLALHPLEDHRVHMIEVGGDQLDHRIQRGRAAGADRMKGRGHGWRDVRARAVKGKVSP
jgi:hypothetical protein